MDIKVGAWGWKHKEWIASGFYPDDLPADWQLAYYSNEFDCGVIPASYWPELCESDNEESWLDDVDDDFVFLIDWPDTADFSPEAKKLFNAFLNDGAAQLIVLINREQLPQMSVEYQQQLQSLNIAAFIYSASLYKSSEKSTASELIKQIDVTNYEQEIADGQSVALLDTDPSESLRDLTPRLKQLINASTGQLILMSEKPSVDRLKEIQTVLSLLNIN